MPITLAVGGIRTEFATDAVEEAFRAASNTLTGDACASLASPAVSQIARRLGLGRTIRLPIPGGQAIRTVYPVDLIRRVEAILGCDPLAGSLRHDPAAPAGASTPVSEVHPRADLADCPPIAFTVAADDTTFPVGFRGRRFEQGQIVEVDGSLAVQFGEIRVGSERRRPIIRVAGRPDLTARVEAAIARRDRGEDAEKERGKSERAALRAVIRAIPASQCFDVDVTPGAVFSHHGGFWVGLGIVKQRRQVPTPGARAYRFRLACRPATASEVARHLAASRCDGRFPTSSSPEIKA